MKISIIVPCYNAQKYLPACLDSLIAQRMEDFEVILIDDGSKDDTAEIAAAYVQRDARFSLIRQENAGVSAARNTGLDAARGEWILFVDADDLLPPEALDNLLSCADEKTDMVVSLHETFGEQQEPRIEYPETLWMNKKGDAKRHAAVLRLIEGDAVLNVMCNKLHRRAFIERENLRLTPGVKIAEDALFNLEAVLCVSEIGFCPRVTYRYRIHPASATQMKTQSEFDLHLPWFAAMAKMLKARGVMERYYSAYFASVVLRLYKDGGIKGVMRNFVRQAKPLLTMKLEGKLSPKAQLLQFLCRTNLYSPLYPVIYPFEVMRRKLREMRFMLRMRRNKRG